MGPRDRWEIVIEAPGSNVATFNVCIKKASSTVTTALKSIHNSLTKESSYSNMGLSLEWLPGADIVLSDYDVSEEQAGWTRRLAAFSTQHSSQSCNILSSGDAMSKPELKRAKR